MKRLLSSAAAILTALTFPGCALLRNQCPGTDHENAGCYCHIENWVIEQPGVKSGPGYDVFYIYPTLSSHDFPALMDWRNNSKTADKARRFVAAQTGGLVAPGAGLFAPYVHQLEFHRAWKLLAKPGTHAEEPELQPGIEDTLRAFRYYLAVHNRDKRPYVLFGHSQGAMDLLEMMKRCPEITPENGFVAAYLIGLPRYSESMLRGEFPGRHIGPARRADDTGVIVGWNTRSADYPVDTVFAGPGVYAINPLTWKTDAAPGSGGEPNSGAWYFAGGTPYPRLKPLNREFTARITPEHGALLVSLPAGGVFDAHGFLGKGCLHMNDVWLFSGRIRANIAQRVEAWRQRYGKDAR